MTSRMAIVLHLVGLGLTIGLMTVLVVINLSGYDARSALALGLTGTKLRLTKLTPQPDFCSYPLPLPTADDKNSRDLTIYPFDSKISGLINCNNGCVVEMTDLVSNEVWMISLIGPSDPKTAVPEVGSVVVDTDSRMVSYTVGGNDDRKRVVLDSQGRMLQWIDETPGTKTRLTFLGYQPETETLIYSDGSGSVYYYLTRGIGLWIDPCR